MPEKRTCQYTFHQEKICEREPLPDSDYCICHEKSDYKYIVPKFKEEIEKIMRDEEAEFYDFRGFYFPKKFNYEDIYKHLEDKYTRKFTKKVNFADCIFAKEPNFLYAKFTKGVDFSESIFEDGGAFFGTESSFQKENSRF